ncbi:MAG TPA: hypothetical protein RMH99_32265 [Sandaracinaceae bacterium LLY-WYZ-13_1]|nr:hypothetical protein [Sandaracinaceae bacterium LLY-WYZ-13_1]
MDEAVTQGAPSCAVHEDAQASGTCERCGDFVCPLCLDPYSGLPDYCAACRERAGEELLPWERDDAPFHVRWARTVRAVLGSPTETLERSRPGGATASLGFSALTGVAEGLSLALLVGCLVTAVAGLGLSPGPAILDGSDAGVVAAVMVLLLAIYPMIFAVLVPLQQLLLALVYHLGVVLAGGRGGFGRSFWIAGYLQAAHLVLVPLGLLQSIPVVGPLIGVATTVGAGLWVSFRLTTAAERLHGLRDGRARFAGWFPFLVAALLVGTCAAFVVVLALGAA